MKTRSWRARYEAAKMKIENLQEIITSKDARIEELEEEVADLELEVSDLEEDAERAEEAEDLYGEDDCDCDDDEDGPAYEMREFLSDIGFDPTNLPATLGERMAIARLLEAGRMFK